MDIDWDSVLADLGWEAPDSWEAFGEALATLKQKAVESGQWTKDEALLLVSYARSETLRSVEFLAKV